MACRAGCGAPGAARGDQGCDAPARRLVSAALNGAQAPSHRPKERRGGMTPIPGKIAEFLQRHHVLSLAVQDAQGLWAASCFYACDLAAGQLIVLTSLKTRHGQQMSQSPVVAGTISGQPEHWRDICGLHRFNLSCRLSFLV